MAKQAIVEQLARNPRLPTLPAITLQVLERANSPDCSLAELARLISHDAALCGKILGLINSAMYSLPRAITSVDKAVQLLGLQRVRSLILALSLPSLHGGGAPKEQLRFFWTTSVAGAITMRALAIRQKWPDPDLELVAGLLRDLGTLALYAIYPQQYVQIMSSPLDQLALSQSQMEEEAFGFNHAELSTYLLQRWSFPVEVSEAIRYHHHPERAQAHPGQIQKRARLLSFASALALLHVQPSQPALLLQVVQTGQEHYGLSQKELGSFLDIQIKQMAEFAALLEVEMEELLNPSHLLTRSLDELSALAVENTLDNLRIQQEKEEAEQQREQAEEALRQAEEQLRQSQKMEAIGRLAGGLAHDFNNLLTVINGFSSVILARLPPGDPLCRYAAEIKKAGEQAASLTQQLLLFGRKQIHNPVPVNLSHLIRDMETLFRQLLTKNIELVLQLDPALHSVEADPGHLQQVLMNLVINAGDAMPEGGTLTIETTNVSLSEQDLRGASEAPPGDHARLVVRDTGCGMDEQTKFRIFEPFFTTKEIGKGTGLGLSIVYGIVKQSSGRITVVSVPGEGTSFSLDFPRMVRAPLPAPASSSPGKGSGGQ